MTGARDPRRIEFDRALGSLAPEERERYKQYFLSLPEEMRDAEHDRTYGIPFYPRPMERTDVKPLTGMRAAGEAVGQAAEGLPLVGTIARATQGLAPWTPPNEGMQTIGGGAELPVWAKGLRLAASITGSLAELKGVGMVGRLAGLGRAATPAAFALSGAAGARGDTVGEWGGQAAIGAGTGLATAALLPWAGRGREAARAAGKTITPWTGLGSAMWRHPVAMGGMGMLGETAQRWHKGQPLGEAAVESLKGLPREAAMGALWAAIGHVGQVRGERTKVAQFIKEAAARSGGKVKPLAEGMEPIQYQGGTAQQQGNILHAYRQIAKAYPALPKNAQVNVVEGLVERARAWATTRPTRAKGGGLGITIEVDARLGDQRPAKILEVMGDEMRHFRKLMLAESHLGAGQQREAAREGKLWRERGQEKLTPEAWAKEKGALEQATIERMKAQGIEPPRESTHPEHVKMVERNKALAENLVSARAKIAEWERNAKLSKEADVALRGTRKGRAVEEVQGRQARAEQGREANLRRAAELRVAQPTPPDAEVASLIREAQYRSAVDRSFNVERWLEAQRQARPAVVERALTYLRGEAAGPLERQVTGRVEPPPPPAPAPAPPPLPPTPAAGEARAAGIEGARQVVRQATAEAVAKRQGKAPAPAGQLPFGQKQAPAAPPPPAAPPKPIGPTEPYLQERVTKLREHWLDRTRTGTYDQVKDPAHRASLERGAQAKSALWSEVEARAKAGNLTDRDVKAINSAAKEMRRRVRAAAPPAPRVAPSAAPVEGALPEERVVRGKKQTMRTSAGNYEGEYALVSADSITLSHNPEGIKRFVENPKFKSKLDQPRDYTAPEEAKQVADLRTKFERDPSAMSIMLNTSPSADSGVPIVSESGVVLNGTKRTLAKRTLDMRGKGAVYDKALDQLAGDFGFTPEQVAAARKKFGRIELVRVVKGVKEGTPQSAAFAAEGNVSTITAQNIYRVAQTYSSLIPDRILQRANVPENATVADALTGPQASEFKTAFRQAVAKVAPQRLTEFFDGENLTTLGKELATNVALVKLVPPQTVEALPASWRNAMLEALPQLIRGIKVKGPANLVPWIKEAMTLRTEIEASGQPFNSKTINDYLNQPAMFGEKTTRTLRPEARMMLDAFDKLATSPAKFRSAVKQFTAGPSLLDPAAATTAERFGKAFGVVARKGATFGEPKAGGKPLGEAAGSPIPKAVLDRMRKTREKAEQVMDAVRKKIHHERVGAKVTKAGSAMRQMFLSPDIELGKTIGGKRVRSAMRNYEQEGASIAEKFAHQAEAIRIRHRLSRAEFDHMGAFLDPKFRSRAPESVLLNPEARAAAGEMKALLNRHFKQAADLGVRVRVELPKGKAKWVPLADMKIEDYWRRAWDPQFTREIMRGRGPIYEGNLKHLVDSGQAKTLKVARNMLAISAMEQTGQAPSWADVSKMIQEAPGVTGQTRRIHWGGFEQRRLDLLPNAYAYTWSKLAQDMAFGYSKMIAGTKYFGQKLEHLIPALKRVAAEQGSDTARSAYTSIVRQMGMEGSSPAGRLVGKVARGAAWSIMSSAKTALAKNVAIGLHRTYSALGGRSLVAGAFAAGKQAARNLGLRLQGKAPEMSLAQRAGAIQAGAHVIESAFGKLGSKLSPWYRVGESILRGTAAEAGMHRLGQSLVALGKARPGSKAADRAQHFLENIINLTPKEIGALKRLHDVALTRKASFRTIGDAYTPFRKLFEKVAYWSAAGTQGVTTPRTLPLPATTEVGRAGSVFYRMAYAGLVNDVRNVVQPLVKQGDVLPLARYVVGGVVAGEGLYALYHALFKREHPAADATTARRMLDNLLAVEGASFASKALESGGRGWKDAAGIVVVDAATELTRDMFDLAGGKLTARQAGHDIGMRSMGLYRDVVQVLEAHGSKDQLRHKLVRAQFRTIGIREGVFSRGGMEIERTERTPYLRALRSSFWSDDPGDWKAAYKATILYLLDREDLTFSEARTRVAQAIADEAPYPPTMTAKGRQKVLERLDEKGRSRFEAAMQAYQERRQRFLTETGMAAEYKRRQIVSRMTSRARTPQLRERLRQRLEQRETQRGRQALEAM